MEYFDRNASVEQTAEADSVDSLSQRVLDPALLKGAAGRAGCMDCEKQEPTSTLVELGDPFDDAMKEKMDIDKFLAKSLQDGNLDALQNMVKLADTRREMRMMQYALRSVDIDNKNLELRLGQDKDGSTLVEVESITTDNKVGGDGDRKSYTLSFTDDSASAVFKNGSETKSVPVPEAIADIQKNINKTLPR